MARRKPAPKDLTGTRQRGGTYQVRLFGGRTRDRQASDVDRFGRGRGPTDAVTVVVWPVRVWRAVGGRVPDPHLPVVVGDYVAVGGGQPRPSGATASAVTLLVPAGARLAHSAARMSSMAETPAGSADTSPPCRPRPSSDSELGFVRRPMVRWLDPHQLIDTAVRVLLSGMFSSYVDNRELQAREPAEVPDRSEEADLWLDYVADVGDG
jgi:hypothetical protein